MKELQVGEGDVDRAEKVKMLEKEVNLAKEVRMFLFVCIPRLTWQNRKMRFIAILKSGISNIASL